jgi:hypothetical protein
MNKNLLLGGLFCVAAILFYFFIYQKEQYVPQATPVQETSDVLEYELPISDSQTTVVNPEHTDSIVPPQVWDSYEKVGAIYKDWGKPKLSWCTKGGVGMYYIEGRADETTVVYYFNKDGEQIGFYSRGVLGDYERSGEIKGATIDMTGFSCEQVPQTSVVKVPDGVKNTSENLVTFDMELDGEYLGYLTRIKSENGVNYIEIDYIQRGTEFCDSQDSLDCPNGAKIVNPDSQLRVFPVNKNAAISVHYAGNNWNALVTFDQLITYNEQYGRPPFWVTLKDSVIEKIQEQYIP